MWPLQLQPRSEPGPRRAGGWSRRARFQLGSPFLGVGAGWRAPCRARRCVCGAAGLAPALGSAGAGSSPLIKFLTRHSPAPAAGGMRLGKGTSTCCSPEQVRAGTRGAGQSQAVRRRDPSLPAAGNRAELRLLFHLSASLPLAGTVPCESVAPKVSFD